MDAPAPPPTLADGDFEKESYVPLSFARERVALVTQQMFDMKARHVEAVGELAAQYRQIEEDTRARTPLSGRAGAAQGVVAPQTRKGGLRHVSIDFL